MISHRRFMQMDLGAWARYATAILICITLALPATTLHSQQFSTGAGLGLGSDTWRADLHAQFAMPLASRLHVAAGLRLTRYGGSNRNLQRQGTADGGFPAELAVDPEIWGLNLMLGFEARLLGPFSAGANLDVLGVAAGPGHTLAGLDIRPARVSMFRYGNADRGSLNSEFYLAAHITPGIAVRAGLSHFVVGYEAGQGDNVRRYLRFDDAVFVAVRWWPGAS